MTKHVVITSNVKATFDLVYPRFNVPVPCYSLQFVAEGWYPGLPTRQSFPPLSRFSRCFIQSSCPISRLCTSLKNTEQVENHQYMKDSQSIQFSRLIMSSPAAKQVAEPRAWTPLCRTVSLSALVLPVFKS